MPIKEGLHLVGSAFTPFYHDPQFIFPAPIKTLEPDALRRAKDTGTVFMDRAGTCQVGYAEGHHEILIWHIGLMFAEYVAGMLAKKAEDGHCRNHKKPCALTRELHLRMLGRLKADLLALVKEIEDIENNEVPTWPAANPPPTSPAPTGGPTTAGR
jgi:hypothetical protein